MARGASAGRALAAAFDGLATGESADVRVVRCRCTTIRFANGRIHQPHTENETHVSYRLADHGRIGTATGVDPSPRGLAALGSAARALARVAPAEPKFPGFPGGTGASVVRVPFSATTASLGPEGASRLAERILAAAASAAPGGRTAGVVNVGLRELSVVNSSGLARSSTTSFAQARVLVDRPERDPPVSGWSEGAHWDVARLDPERLGREAGERVARTEPAPVPPGNYRVVLRGPAFAEALAFLALLGFGGQGEVEGWSCLRRRRGRRIAPEFVDIADDPRSAHTVPSGIDFEGVPTRRTPIVEHGIAAPAVTDLVTAGRLGRPLTGHAPPPESPHGESGPTPDHLVVASGDAREEELVSATRRGVLVTRFHYVRIVDPGRGIITGMTRDGTYRIERGEVVGPARNLRFTESVLRLLAGVELVGAERRIHADERGSVAQTVPSVAVRAFRFTSATLF